MGLAKLKPSPSSEQLGSTGSEWYGDGAAFYLAQKA